MKRTQIYLDEDLDAELRRVAEAEGRSAAAIIREALRAYLVRTGEVRVGLMRLQGLGKEIWEGEDAKSYLDRLRGEWDR